MSHGPIGNQPTEPNPNPTLQRRRQIRRRRHTRAPTPGGTADIRRPAPATTPTSCCKRTSARSDKEPNPRVHTKPMSSPSPAPTPSARCDMAPNPGLPQAPTPDRSPAPSPSVRKCRDLLIRRSSGWYFSTTGRRESCGHGRCSTNPSYLWRARVSTLYCVSSPHAAHDRHLALLDLCTALGSGNLRRSLADNHRRLAFRIHFDAINSVPLSGTNGDVGGINFHLRLPLPLKTE